MARNSALVQGVQETWGLPGSLAEGSAEDGAGGGAEGRARERKELGKKFEAKYREPWGAAGAEQRLQPPPSLPLNV